MNFDPFELDMALLPNQKKLRNFSWVLLGVMIIVAFIFYQRLPEEIPRHFNAKGEVDAYGSKDLIWFLLGAFIFMNVMLYFTIQYPRFINFPVKVTPQNAQKQYYNVVDMTMILNVLINIIGLVILYMTIDYETTQKYHINKAIGLMTLVCAGVVIYYFIRGYRNN
jgi:uncharacterized membrane protein